MINPSDINLHALPWLPLTEKSAFPKQAAIYFAIDSQGSVQYIGRSVNVRARWGSHHKYSALNKLGDIKIAYLFVDMPELLPQIETALIEYFQPPLNNSVGRPRRERPIERANYKLDSGIRSLFKSFIQVKRMTEGVAVEKAMLQVIAFDRLVNRGVELTYESVEKEIESIWIELTQDENDD